MCLIKLSLNAVEMQKKATSCENKLAIAIVNISILPLHKGFHSLWKNFQAFHRTLSSDTKLNVAIKLILKASALSREGGLNIGLHYELNVDEISSRQILKVPTTHDKSERNSHSHKNHSSSFSSTKDKHSGNPKIIQALVASRGYNMNNEI